MELTGATVSGSSLSDMESLLTGAEVSSDTSSAITMITELTGHEVMDESSDESLNRCLTGAIEDSDMSPEIELTGASGLSDESDQLSTIEVTKTRKGRRGGRGSSDVPELTGATGLSDTSDLSLTTLLTGASGFSDESDPSLITELTGATGLSDEDSITLLTGATGLSDDESYTLLTGATGLSDDESYTLLTGATGLSDTSDMSLTTLLTGTTDLSDISLTTELTGASGLSDSEDLSLTTLLTGTTGLSDEDYDLLTGADIDDITSDVSNITLATTDVSSVSSATSRATTDAPEITKTTPALRPSETSGASGAADSLGPVTVVEPEHKASNSRLTRAERRARRRARRKAASMTSQDEPHKLGLPKKVSKRRRRRKSRSRSRSRGKSRSDKEVRKVNPRSGNVRNQGPLHKPITLTLRPSPINVVTKDATGEAASTNQTQGTSVASGITMTTTDVEPVTINTNASNTHNVSMVTSGHAQFELQVGHVSSFGGGNVDTENQKSTNSEGKRDKQERNLRVQSSPDFKVTKAMSRPFVNDTEVNMEESDRDRHVESRAGKSRPSSRRSGTSNCSEYQKCRDPRQEVEQSDGRKSTGSLKSNACAPVDPMMHHSGSSRRPESARAPGKSKSNAVSGRGSRSRQSTDEKDVFLTDSESRRSGYLVGGCPEEDMFSGRRQIPISSVMSRNSDSHSPKVNDLRSKSETSGKIRSRPRSSAVIRSISRAETGNLVSNPQIHSETSTRNRSRYGACAVLFNKKENAEHARQPKFEPRPSIVVKILEEIARRKNNNRIDSGASGKKTSGSRTESRTSRRNRSGSRTQSRTSETRSPTQIATQQDRQTPDSKAPGKTRSGSRSASGTVGNLSLNSKLKRDHGNVKDLRKFFETRINLLAPTTATTATATKQNAHVKLGPNGNGNNMATDRSTSGTTLSGTSSLPDGAGRSNVQRMRRRYDRF